MIQIFVYLYILPPNTIVHNIVFLLMINIISIKYVSCEQITCATCVSKITFNQMYTHTIFFIVCMHYYKDNSNVDDPNIINKLYQINYLI